MEQNRFATVDARFAARGNRPAHGATKMRSTAAEQWRLELRRCGIEPIE